MESRGRGKLSGALPVPYLNCRSIVRTSEITFISTTCDSWLIGGNKGHGPRFQARKELNSKAIARSVHSQTSFLSNQGAQLGNVAGLAQMRHRCGGKNNLLCMRCVCTTGGNGVCLVTAWNLRPREDSRGPSYRLELVFSKSPPPPTSSAKK